MKDSYFNKNRAPAPYERFLHALEEYMRDRLSFYGKDYEHFQISCNVNAKCKKCGKLSKENCNCWDVRKNLESGEIMSTVYMTIGFLGSGKSTWARNFIKDKPKTKIVSPDGFRQMLNGEYKYIAELDDVITQSVFDTAVTLISFGYDVIIDCGNLTEDADRRGKWKQFKYYDDNIKLVAVVFPQKNIEWHVKNRMRKPHWEEVDWYKIAEGERKAFQPINEKDYDEVIYVKEW